MASTPALLTFSEVLEAQLDHSLPYPTLKQLLRTLKRYHPAYPSFQHPGSGQFSALSQTQKPQLRKSAHQQSPNQQQESNGADGQHTFAAEEHSVLIGAERNAIPGLNDTESIREPDENEHEKEDLFAIVETPRAQSLGPAQERGERTSIYPTEYFPGEQHRSPLKQITLSPPSGDNTKKRPHSAASPDIDEKGYITPLKRRKRGSRRRPLCIPSSSDESEAENTSNKENDRKTRKEFANYQQVTSNTNSSGNRNQFLKESFPQEVGEQINKTIYKLLKQSDDGRQVTWCDLRGTLERQSRVYKGFCVSMDKLFRQSDPLASGATPESSQNSKGSKSCIFYSNRFWDEVWCDYLESGGRTGPRPNRN